MSVMYEGKSFKTEKKFELNLTGNIINNNSVLTLFLNSQPNFFAYCTANKFLKILNFK
jgi:hypothetical protein